MSMDRIELNRDNCFSISLFGEPVPQQSFQFRYTGTGIRAKKTKALARKNVLREAIKYQLPHGFKMFEGPLFCFVYFVFFPPKRLNRYQKKRINDNGRLEKFTIPDEDNLKKNLYDAMQGIIYRNDSQICGGSYFKGYGKYPGINVLIYRLQPEPLQVPRDPVVEEFFRLPDALFDLSDMIGKNKYGRQE